MANIPVERDAATPWWYWLLGALLLLAVLWFLFAVVFDDDDDIVADPVEEVEPIAEAEGMDLSDVVVTRVVGDKTFYVAPDENSDREMLVYLVEESTPGATEGRYDVTAGQHLRIDGTIQEIGDTNLAQWGLSDDEASMLTPNDEYIRATSLTVLGDDMASGEVPSGEITSLGDLDALMASPTDDMAGRSVRLSGVTVTGLAGDSTFYIGEGDNRVLVVLGGLGEGQSGPGDGSDGRFDINVGQSLTLDGELMRFRRGARGTASMAAGDMDEADRRRLVIAVRDASNLSIN